MKFLNGLSQVHLRAALFAGGSLCKGVPAKGLSQVHLRKAFRRYTCLWAAPLQRPFAGTPLQRDYKIRLLRRSTCERPLQRCTCERSPPPVWAAALFAKVYLRKAFRRYTYERPFAGTLAFGRHLCKGLSQVHICKRDYTNRLLQRSTCERPKLGGGASLSTTRSHSSWVPQRPTSAKKHVASPSVSPGSHAEMLRTLGKKGNIAPLLM